MTSIQEIELSRLLIDETISPRDRVNPKHVDEFVEMAGDWPPVLVRPIEDEWYTHQLIDGFHRTQAAETLCCTTIRARVEIMDDDTAIARALRENLHGLPLTADQRQTVCVRLWEMGWTQERIAKETGVVHSQVNTYLSANRVQHELSVTDNSITPSMEQSARLAKLVPDKPTLLTDPKREAARAQVPTLAKAAADHHLPPPVVSALADATLDAPEEAPRLIERAVTEKLAPDAIRTAGKVLADPHAPEALKARIRESETLIQDAQGNIPDSEVGRLRKLHEQRSPSLAAMPFAGALIKLSECVLIAPETVDAWLDATPQEQWQHAEYTLQRITEWAEEARKHFTEKRREALKVVH